MHRKEAEAEAERLDEDAGEDDGEGEDEEENTKNDGDDDDDYDNGDGDGDGGGGGDGNGDDGENFDSGYCHYQIDGKRRRKRSIFGGGGGGDDTVNKGRIFDVDDDAARQRRKRNSRRVACKRARVDRHKNGSPRRPTLQIHKRHGEREGERAPKRKRGEMCVLAISVQIGAYQMHRLRPRLQPSNNMCLLSRCLHPSFYYQQHYY